MTTGPRLSRARSIRGGDGMAVKMSEQERAARLSEVRPVRSASSACRGRISGKSCH